jgi:hypothetical protein
MRFAHSLSPSEGKFLNTTYSLPPVNVAIFASRETPEVLARTIAATLKAAGQGSCVDVLVNGNRLLAERAARAFRHSGDATHDLVRVWHMPRGDKANAWNQHIHRIWDFGALVFYVDGYVSLASDAIVKLHHAMNTHPDALAGSGVPSVGRSSAQLRQELLTLGGMHGNLCCIRDSALRALRQRNIRIPLGLYRTDSTIGAMLSFGLNPSANEWNPLRYIALAPDATWHTDDKKWWRWADLRATYQRRDRQAQGQLENRAVRDHLAIQQLPPEKMPQTAAELVLQWVARCPDDAAEVLRGSRRVQRALCRLQAPGELWRAADTEAVRVKV